MQKMRKPGHVHLVLGCAFLGAAAPVTFIVSPDTHFTQSGGVGDVQKNRRGIADMKRFTSTMSIKS